MQGVLHGFEFAFCHISHSIALYTSCYSNGSLLLLFLPISRHSRNILDSPVHAASISVWHLPQPSAKQARVSLMGKVSVFGDSSGIDPSLRQCYLKAHPDATRWLPDEPDSPHLVTSLDLF